MKAMLFAAGLGSRLRPLTNDRPKALVEVNGKSLLVHNLTQLLEQGFDEVIINVHYHAEQLMEQATAFFQTAFPAPVSGQLHTFSPDNRLLLANSSIRARCAGASVASARKPFFSDERALLLDTGGGLLRAKKFLEEDHFLTHNVDILSSLDIAAMYRWHLAQGGLATLAVRQRPSSRQLLFETERNTLVAWRHQGSGEQIDACPSNPAARLPYAFSGIAVYSPRIFEYMLGQEGQPFSIITTLLKAAAHEDIYAYPHDQDRWIDVGRPEDIAAAEKLFA